MLRTLLLFAIITALGSLPSKAQSDDGWFTGRLLLLCGGDGDNGCRIQVKHAQYYNFSNMFSLGCGFGYIMDNSPLMPFSAEFRLRPSSRHGIMPMVLFSGGYAVPLGGDGKGQSIITPRIGLETGRLARFRCAFDVGCQVLGGNCNWIVGAGVVF